MENKDRREATFGNVKIKGWNEKRTVYACIDSVEVLLPNKTIARSVLDQNSSGGTGVQIKYINGVGY